MARNFIETHIELLRNPRLASLYLKEALKEGDPRLLSMVREDIAEAERRGIKRADHEQRSINAKPLTL